MTRIGLLSDTHGFLDEQVFRHFEECHEIWHAGDFGIYDVVESLKKWRDKDGYPESGRSDGDRQTSLKGVYGNIDGPDIRSEYPEQLVFMCEDVKVMIRHIGGYPPRYNPATKKELLDHRPQLFICGHSHILKIMYDDKLQCLHMNPGAAGKQGWQKIRTLIRFAIDGADIKDCEVIELGTKNS